jgi:hypothetical protein
LRKLKLGLLEREHAETRQTDEHERRFRAQQERLDAEISLSKVLGFLCRVFPLANI